MNIFPLIGENDTVSGGMIETETFLANEGELPKPDGDKG